MPAPEEEIELLLKDLPDEEGARLFFERISAEHARGAQLLRRDRGLLSDTLALAAWSPLLATTLTQHTEYLQWLARERTHSRVKTREELEESLGRFALTHSQLDPQVLLARFRRRELLRIYLRDIRRTSTLVETTDELSNLADAVIGYALSHARQHLDNRYGPPLRADERGRKAPAEFAIVALGKLGSFELNYASDIDLFFIFSNEGETAAGGTHGETTNREYFVRLAEMIARIVGQPTGEGAAYRVDLRLRPHGRDGALASSLDEAVRYYREQAQAWERQTLIRARAAAGSAALYARFAARVAPSVYAVEQTVEDALRNVRLAKQKIDHHHARDTRGFNVKLGRGGIREIEFIAQALQLAYGSRDEWLRAPHTLISLGRLADRGLIHDRERVTLSDAYVFLRMLEHRLQMEHGLQTHSVPDEAERRRLVARRMHFSDEHLLADFDRALAEHTTQVRAVFERIFGREEADEPVKNPARASASGPAPEAERARQQQQPEQASVTAAEVAALTAARLFAPHLAQDVSTQNVWTVERVARFLNEAAGRSLNARRALTYAASIAASLDKSTEPLRLSEQNLAALIQLCGASEFFGDQLASNPSLILALPVEGAPAVSRDYRALLKEAVEGQENFRAELGALRRTWARLLIEIGALDAAGLITMRESNRRQTELAAASLDAGCLVARRDLSRRYGELDAETRLAVLGLGRLGGGGMDYGSDLDVVLIYDDAHPSPVRRLTPAEAYGRLSERLIAALSSLTREGSLYRMDLRLRPDGRNGLTATGARSFTDYLRERALPWEWLAYVKLRAAGGDTELGRAVEERARQIIHERASQIGEETLRTETRRVRERLEQEKAATRAARGGTDIKYGPGGMLDVYFATRYLQLRHDVREALEDRSTRATLERLRAAGALDERDYTAMNEGYAYLRTLDHYLRLIVGRSTRLPATDHPALRDIARCMNHASARDLTDALAAHRANIRAAYDRITGKG
ncbi:MAG TPA: bifunctional [glutamate--ammonia ligase]-adenylyl-L-tyrosine phosphorylase/[glutamate--ammonia-ligase] adenylyltransferase [Pyrinomonadaceae bacterium]